VLASNRDEFLSRPTVPLGYWDDSDTILAGRDLEAGGTWLGINSGGRFAALTNYREVAGNVGSANSRGELIPHFLRSTSEIQQFADSLPAISGQYRGFNLLFGDQQQMLHYSNRERKAVALVPGIYGISNRLLDTDWPKVVRGKTLLKEQLESKSFTAEDLFTLLRDSNRPDDSLLPDTGVGIEWERLLSTIFIRGRTYGTRSSAVLLVHQDNTTEFWERSYPLDETGSLKTDEKYFIITP